MAAIIKGISDTVIAAFKQEIIPLFRDEFQKMKLTIIEGKCFFIINISLALKNSQFINFSLGFVLILKSYLVILFFFLTAISMLCFCYRFV